MAKITAIEFHDRPAFMLEAQGARAIVSPFGAQLLSWRPAGGRERLFVSNAAVFDGVTPIRGGVPVCFPQFSMRGPGEKHGFGRTVEWLVSEQRMIDDTALLTLQLPADARWPYQACVELSVLLDATRVDIEFGVDNTGNEPLQFTAALHTYLTVDDIDEVAITGLRGCRFVDSAAGDAEGLERGDAVRIDSGIDRIYADVRGALLLHDGSAAVGINADHFRDVVVWNPGPEKAAALTDLAPGEWQGFVCIEAGAILEPVLVEASDTWWGRQSLVDLTLAVAANPD